jgi:hypothetical protein
MNIKNAPSKIIIYKKNQSLDPLKIHDVEQYREEICNNTTIIIIIIIITIITNIIININITIIITIKSY